MWICHTLRNELLGAASVSLGSLLKGGGKRTYQGCGHRTRAAGTLPGLRAPGLCPRRHGAGVAAVAAAGPAGNKVPLCAPGRACRKPYLRQPGSETQTPLLFLCYSPPFAVARAWLVTAAPT